MKTSLENIVDFLMKTESQTLVVTAECSTAQILISLVDNSTGLDVSGVTGLSERLKYVSEHQEDIDKCLTYPDGRSKFFCLETPNFTFEDLKVKIMACTLENGLKQVVIEPDNILLRGVEKSIVDDWCKFKMALEYMYGTVFTVVTDNMEGRDDSSV